MSDLKYPDKNRGVAIALSYFVGLFGVHRFYLGEKKKGLIYFAFSWTTIPVFLGFYDGFKYFRNPGWFSETTTSQVKSQKSDGSQLSDSEQSLSNDAVMSVTGANGEVTLYDDRLEISRDDIGMIHKVQHGFKGDKEIPYDSITSMQLRKASKLSRGYLQFGQKGFSESDDGLLDAVSDENTVLFDEDKTSDFEELRSKVRDLKKGEVKQSTGSMDGALEKLRERYAEGDIDEEEYEQRKEILEQG